MRKRGVKWKSDKYSRFKYLDPRASAVQRKTRRAVAAGRLVKPKNCSKCGRTDKPIQAHHEDYSEPFKVTWLCTGCHADIHNAEKYGLDGEARKKKEHERDLRRKLREHFAVPLGSEKKA